MILNRQRLPPNFAPAQLLMGQDGLRGVWLDKSNRPWTIEVDIDRRRADLQALPRQFQNARTEALSHSGDTAFVVEYLEERTVGTVFQVGTRWLNSIVEIDLSTPDPKEWFHTLGDRYHMNFCLSPSGRFLMCILEKTAWIMNLSPQYREYRFEPLHALHTVDEGNGIRDTTFDSPDATITLRDPNASPDVAEGFWLVVGEYGRCTSYLIEVVVTPQDWMLVKKVHGAARGWNNAYDSTTGLWAGKQLVFWDVEGLFFALQVETGACHDYPLGRGRDLVPCGSAPLACIDSRYIWQVGGPVTPIELPGKCLALYDDSALCLTDDALAWCALPERA